MNHAGYIARTVLGTSFAMFLLHAGDAYAADAKPQAHVRYDALKRDDFNRRAAEHYLPLFWKNDANGNGAIDPAELAVLWGFPQSDVHAWIGSDGAFTARFAEAYAQMRAAWYSRAINLPSALRPRRRTILHATRSRSHLNASSVSTPPIFKPIPIFAKCSPRLPTPNSSWSTSTSS